MSPANEPRQSKSERTAAAREKAREIREAQLKKEKRNKLLIGWGIVAAVVGVVVRLHCCPLGSLVALSPPYPDGIFRAIRPLGGGDGNLKAQALRFLP